MSRPIHAIVEDDIRAYLTEARLDILAGFRALLAQHAAFHAYLARRETR